MSFRRLNRWHLLHLLVPIALAPLAWLVVGQAWLAAGIAGFLGTLGILAYRGRLDALTRRIESDAGPVWAVEVNDVPIGAITDAEYARYCLAALEDWRVFILQAANLLRAVLRVVNNALAAIPLAVFWGAAILAIHAPATLVEDLRLVLELPAEAISDGARALFSFVVAVVGVASVAVVAMDPGGFGLRNEFDAATGRRIRRHFGVTTDGKVSLSGEIRVSQPVQAPGR